MTQAKKMPYKTTFYPLFSSKMRRFGYKSPGNRVKTPPAVTIHRENFCPKKFVSKERDIETGLYYFGARYLDSRTGRWISGDPAVGEYIPSAPVDDEARKRNQNLPGMGGVFNAVNLHVYHYAGNNPVKYTDPDGNYLGIKSQLDRNAARRKEYYAPNVMSAWIAKGNKGTDIPKMIDDAEQADLDRGIFHKDAKDTARSFGLDDEQAEEYANKEKQRYENILIIRKGRGNKAVDSMMESARKKYDDTYNERGVYNPKTGRTEKLTEYDRKRRAEDEANKIIDKFIEDNI